MTFLFDLLSKIYFHQLCQISHQLDLPSIRSPTNQISPFLLEVQNPLPFRTLFLLEPPFFQNSFLLEPPSFLIYFQRFTIKDLLSKIYFQRFTFKDLLSKIYFHQLCQISHQLDLPSIRSPTNQISPFLLEVQNPLPFRTHLALAWDIIDYVFDRF